MINFEAKKGEMRNNSTLSAADCFLMLGDDSRRFEDMSDEDLDSIYACAMGHWAYHLPRQGYIDALYKKRNSLTASH